MNIYSHWTTCHVRRAGHSRRPASHARRAIRGGRPGRVRGHFELEVEILRREEERRLALREVLGLSSHRLLLAEEAEQLEARVLVRHLLREELEERERILPEARAVRLARRRRLEHLIRGARPM